MNSQKQWGFTIIELILFLGITGLLFAGLMVGVNTNIATQRYKESAVGYKAVFEKQYSLVEHPQNSRNGNWNCDMAAVITQSPAGGIPRGTSRCVLLGRYIELKNGGTQVEVGDAVGVDPGLRSDGVMSDLDEIKAYQPRKSPIDVETIAVGWGSQLKTDDNKESTASYLILRSPLSGSIRTFGSKEPLSEQLTSAVTQESSLSVIKNCIIPSGYVSVPVYSVTVSAVAGGVNSVALDGNDETC